MARIRTIKPEFFRHEALFVAELETGLPLRVAFVGLWTVADREGRFRWRPAALKLDCLPFDALDFSRVLDALATRGFVVRYESDGEAFGYIPTFSRHQVVNHREAASVLPEPPPLSPGQRRTPAGAQTIATPPGAPGQGKGTPGQASGEGEQEQEQKSPPNPPRGERERGQLDEQPGEQNNAGKPSKRAATASEAPDPSATTAGKAKRGRGPATADPEGFAEFWGVYPRRVARADAVAAWRKLAPGEALRGLILAAAAKLARSPDALRESGRFLPYPATWLNGQRWQDETAPGPTGEEFHAGNNYGMPPGVHPLEAGADSPQYRAFQRARFSA